MADARRPTSASPGSARLARLVLVLVASLSVLAASANSDGKDADDGIATKPQPMEQELVRHYFAHEIDFLAKHAMILGNHPGAGNATSKAEEEVARLRFIEHSLRMELDYIRRLKAMKAEAEANPSLAADATTNSTHQKKTRRRFSASKAIVGALRDATWSTLAFPPAHTPNLDEMDHGCDYDWIAARGLGNMYDELQCHDQVYDQNKPLYTVEMWNKLKEEFAKSTLFPFPIPDADESPVEPFRVDHTKDSKGRGCFASERIKKGSLVHSGHPNTVFFLDNESWYRFSTALPKMLACDVMEWAWQQDLTDSGNVVMALNLDEAVFFNDGGWDSSVNMEMRDPTSLDFYATRDIEAGEELLYDYDHFVFRTEEMDL